MTQRKYCLVLAWSLLPLSLGYFSSLRRGGFGLASGVTCKTGLSAAAGNIGVTLILGGAQACFHHSRNLLMPVPTGSEAKAQECVVLALTALRGAMGHENYRLPDQLTLLERGRQCLLFMAVLLQETIC